LFLRVIKEHHIVIRLVGQQFVLSLIDTSSSSNRRLYFDKAELLLSLLLEIENFRFGKLGLFLGDSAPPAENNEEAKERSD